MTTQEFKDYFEARGGKKGVKSSDAIWSGLIRFINEQNKNKKGYKKLSPACGSCRATAYRLLMQM